MASLGERLHALGPSISKILSTSATAGAAVGVSYQGNVVHTAGFGLRDVARGLPMDVETVVALFSLTKGMTACALGTLVDERDDLSWNSTLKSILSDFRHQDSRLEEEASLTDLLTHRAGIGEYNMLFMQDHGKLYLPKDQTLPTFSKLPTTAAFREKFQYQNWNYAVLALAAEKLSGISLGRFFMKNFFEPLGMARTSVTRPKDDDINVSEGYMALSNGYYVKSDRPCIADDTIMFGAMGVNSCVKDLLVYYDALLQAQDDQFKSGTTATGRLPFKQVPSIFSGYIPTANPTLLDRSYGFGFHRAQLPNPILGGRNPQLISPLPVIARGVNSTLIVYGTGNSAASQNVVILHPETRSSIVVLTNTMANCDAASWIAYLILETLLDSPEKNDFVALSEKAAKKNIGLWKEMHETLMKDRIPNTQSRPLREYTGKYWNKLGNWFFHVSLEGDVLKFSFRDDTENTHMLRHYHHDVFSWEMSQDENSAAGRFPLPIADQWLLKFDAENGAVKGLTWSQFGMKEGEYFSKGHGLNFSSPSSPSALRWNWPWDMTFWSRSVL